MTVQIQQRLDIYEISQKGQRLLDALPEKVKEEHHGRFIADVTRTELADGSIVEDE